MGLMKHLKKLEEKIDNVLGSGPDSREPTPDQEVPNGALKSGGGQSVEPTPAAPRAYEPLVLRKAIVHRIEGELRRIDGTLSFPFNRIDVSLWASDARRRALLEAEMVDGARLEQDVLRLFQGLKAQFPAELSLIVRFEDQRSRVSQEALENGFELECTREAITEKMNRSRSTTASLVVEQGEAEVETVPLDRARTNIGRLREVTDHAGRVIRRNHLVFSECPGVNETVSRIHAYVAFDSERDEYRLFDDNSGEGTVLFRNGRRIGVPQGPRRGVPLMEGDEIYLGQARVRFMR